MTKVAFLGGVLFASGAWIGFGHGFDNVEVWILLALGGAAAIPSAFNDLD